MKTMKLCVEEGEVTGDYGLALQAFIINPFWRISHIASRKIDFIQPTE